MTNFVTEAIQAECRKRGIRFIRPDSDLDEALLNDKMWKELIDETDEKLLG